MGTTIKGIAVQIGGSLSGLGEAVDKAGSKLFSLQSVVKSVGAAMAASFGADTLIRAGKAVITLSSQYEASLTKINTLVGVSESQVQQWGDALLKIGPETARGPNELAEAMFVVSSAGQRGAEALTIVEQAAKASALGLGETSEIARAVTAAINAYGAESLNAAQATDILTAIVREGNLEASELAPTLGKVIPIAAQLGVSFEEVGANIATFTRLGVNSAESVTGLRGVLTALLAPSKEAGDALESVGLSADGLRKEVREKGLNAVLAHLMKAFEGNTDALFDVIGRVEGLTNVLGTSGRQAEAYDDALHSMQNSAGIVNREFEKLKETLAFQFKQAKANAEAFAITLGSKLLPHITTAVDDVNDLAAATSSLSSALADAAGGQAAGAFSEVLRELVTYLGSTGLALIKATAYQLELLSKAVKASGDTISAATVHWKALGMILGILDVPLKKVDASIDSIATKNTIFSNSLGDVEQGVAALFNPLDGLVKKTEEAGEKTKLTKEELEKLRKEAAERWKPVLDELTAAIAKHGAALEPLPDELEDIDKAARKAWSESGMKSRIDRANDALDEMHKTLMDGSKAAEMLGGKLRGAGDAGEGAGVKIKNSFSGALANIASDWDRVTGIVDGVINNDWGGIVTAFFAPLGPWAQAIGMGASILQRLLGGGGVDTQAILYQALQSLRRGFEEIENESLVLGDSFDRANAEIRLLEDALIDMLNNSVDPSSPAYLKLRAALDIAREGAKLASQAFADAFGGTGAPIVIPGLQEWADSFDWSFLEHGTDLANEWADAMDEANIKWGRFIPAFIDPIRDLVDQLPAPGTLESLMDTVWGGIRIRLEAMAAQAEALGKPLDAFAAEADLIRKAIIELVDKGFRPGDAVLDSLTDRLKALTDQSEKYYNALPKASVIDGIMNSFTQGIALIEQRFTFFNDEAQRTQEMIRLIERTMEELANTGGEDALAMFNQLAAMLAELTGAAAEAGDAVGDLGDEIGDLGDEAQSTPPPVPAPAPGGDGGGGGGTIGFPSGTIDVRIVEQSPLFYQMRDILQNVVAAIIATGTLDLAGLQGRLRSFIGATGTLGLGNPFGPLLRPPPTGNGAAQAVGNVTIPVNIGNQHFQTYIVNTVTGAVMRAK